MHARTFLLVAGLLSLPLLGQTTRNQPAASSGITDGSAAARPDSTTRILGAAPAHPPSPDSLSLPKSRADTVLVVKHRFDHREQIITGSVVMTCLALMMVIMNNYNPR